MIISPDEGSMSRAVYLANVLGVNMGMYYKRLDYTRYENGHHPIAAYEFLGPKLHGQDMILIDDMISSGDTVIKIASLLKERGAGKIFICCTFGHFTNGLQKFDDAYEQGIFDKLLTTNMIYQSPELLEKPYYISCDMSKYIALIIDTLNHDLSVSTLLNPVDRIKRCVENYQERQK
jgi:ribose-phosphate pyrophosphokinase